MRSLLYLPAIGPLDSASLILLFLYGNLFCYVASYPVLVFHATRVLDFRGRSGSWPGRVYLDGYITTAIVLLLAFLSHLVTPQRRYWPGYSLAAVIAIIQFARIYFVLFPRVEDPIRYDTVSPAFGYSSQLAWRRGSPKIEIGTKQTEDAEERRIASEDSWRLEFMDTYRHLREHGNSAFIFTLELALAALVSCVVTKPAQSASHQLSAIGVLFAIWAFPSMLVHLLAQHLERRFSRYYQTRNP